MKKNDTMKTDLLKTSPAVEPKAGHPDTLQDPAQTQ
jgi:hypothetical protein